MANKSTVTPEMKEKRRIALNECMSAYKLKPIDLINAGCGNPSEISYFIHGSRALTPYVVERLYDNVFKEKGVRLEYLMGDSPFMTNEAYETANIIREPLQEVLQTEAAKGLILSEALEKVCEIEGSEMPSTSSFFKDLPFLSAQLENEAQKIIWSYLHRNDSPLWTYVDKHKS